MRCSAMQLYVVECVAVRWVHICGTITRLRTMTMLVFFISSYDCCYCFFFLYFFSISQRDITFLLTSTITLRCYWNYVRKNVVVVGNHKVTVETKCCCPHSTATKVFLLFFSVLKLPTYKKIFGKYSKYLVQRKKYNKQITLRFIYSKMQLHGDQIEM